MSGGLSRLGREAARDAMFLAAVERRRRAGHAPWAPGASRPTLLRLA